MFKPKGYETASTELANKLPAGGYVAIILDIEDVEAKEYLKITYDIHEGEYKGYHKKQEERWGNAFNTFIVSYSEKSVNSLKRFIEAVEDSNKGFHWDWDNPRTAIKRGVGIVLQEEEYVNNSGEVKTRLSNFITAYTCNEIRQGKYSKPTLRKLKGNQNQTQAPATKQSNFIEQATTIDINDDDIQF